MNKALKLFLMALLTGALAVALTGCGSSGKDAKPAADGAKALKVGVCIYQYNDTYISTVRNALQKIQQENPGKVEFLMNDGKNDQATQNDQIDLLIQQKVDALLVNMVDAGNTQAVVNKAKAANIPVIFFNREQPGGAAYKTWERTLFVGTTAKDAGIIQGKILAKAWKADTARYDLNKDGIMDYVMLKGDADNPEAIARSEYVIKTLNEEGIKTHEVAQQICNWDTQLAQQAVQAWLSKDPKTVEVVIANNDGMAQGAVAALQAIGKNTDANTAIPVVGVDATDPAKDLISKGQMYGTVLQDGPAMAKACYTICLNAPKAAKLEDFVAGTEYKIDESGYAIRIPYQAYER